MLKVFRIRWVYHSLIWLAMLLSLIFVAYGSNQQAPFWKVLSLTFFFVCATAVSVYTNFYLKKQLFENRHYLYYFISLILIILATATFVRWLPIFAPIAKTSFQQELINFTVLHLLAIGLQYLKRGIVGQYQLQELKAKNAEMELSALKSQVNPHFLFNTLNNIYSISQLEPQKGIEMILELSEVMRYHLSFSRQKQVTLEEEMQLIESYLALERIRFEDNLSLRTDFQQIDHGLHIAPLILLTFIENAFKHGTHPVNPCFIHMSLKTDQNTLLFTIENSIIHDQSNLSTLVGLENTQRRLTLLYPNRHQLSITNTNNTYSLKLTLTL
ncbi:MAG TPA: hypothetical protein DCS93_34980 [Microscillaceae bacterium]|nr:hypothetical protein [Microscillaceae bacterium]